MLAGGDTEMDGFLPDDSLTLAMKVDSEGFLNAKKIRS
jgi:hypothetical protein